MHGTHSHDEHRCTVIHQNLHKVAAPARSKLLRNSNRTYVHKTEPYSLMCLGSPIIGGLVLLAADRKHMAYG